MFAILSAHFKKLCGLMYVFSPMLICPRILEVFLLPGKLSPVAICRCLGRGGRDGWERGAVGGGLGKGPLGICIILSETGDLFCVFVLSGFVCLFVGPSQKSGWKGKGLQREDGRGQYCIPLPWVQKDL